MTWKVKNLRRGRPVTDPATGIVLRGTITLSDEQIAALGRNPVIRAMLGCDQAGVPHGSGLLEVQAVAEPKVPEEKPKKAKAPEP